MRFEDVPARATAAQLRLLEAHLPYSIGLLRRLQSAAGALEGGASAFPADSTRLPDGTSEWAHVLFVYDGDEEEPTPATASFAAAYVDLSKAPETQVWLYASDEDVDGSDDGTAVPQVDRGAALTAAWPPARHERAGRLVRALFRRVRTLAREQAPHVPAIVAHCTEHVKVNMHEALRHVVRPRTGGVGQGEGAFVPPSAEKPHIVGPYWDAYDRWLFRLEDVPAESRQADGLVVRGLDHPLRWDVVHQADVPLVKSRTHIVRQEETLLLVPSAGLRDNGTLIAWAFLGLDGSIWTLHCEEAYRGRGIAKALAARLIRRYNGVFSDDGWCQADVAATNPASQAVCRSLGGKRTWSSSWNLLDYDSFGADVAGEWP